jgi:glucosamine--fructose-6-phosphate aminotransferase (isomerizing)
MASEIGESADVVANIVRGRAVTRDVAQRIGIGCAPLCVVCGRDRPPRLSKITETF